MKVLLVLTYYSPYISGVTEFARMLAEYLSARHEVTVLATHHAPSTPAEEVINGVRVVRSPVALRMHKGVISPRFVMDFQRLARTHDVIDFHLPMLEAGLLSWLCDRRRLTATYQCDMAITGGLLDRVAVRAARTSARIALRRAARVFVTTMDYARTSPIAAPAGARLVEVRAPIKKPPASFDFEGGDPSPSLGPRVGFVGRFVEEKGLPVLLEAFKAVLRHIPHARLVLVGQSEGVAGGSVINSIDAAIRSLGGSVELCGKVGEEELWRIYRGLDVLVLPSTNRYEAFGMVQIEAMMAGALVVASDLPGVRTIIQNTGCGAIAQVGDPCSLADALLHVLQMRAHVSRLEVRNRVLEHYPPERSLQVQAQVLAEVARAAGRI